MKNFKFIISYDGSRYYGWERQPNRETIQGKLESVLSRMCDAPVQVIGAGRTDAGVHAKAMTANAYMDTEKTPDEIRDYMNHYLPDDICVQEARLAADRFHARYRAVGVYSCPPARYRAWNRSAARRASCTQISSGRSWFM